MNVVALFVLAAAVLAQALEIAPESQPSLLVFPPYLHSYGIRKATQTKLKLFLGPLASFDDPQGLVCVRMHSRDDPATPKDDDEVTVYGVNSGRNQIIYNTSMYGITGYGRKGSGVGEFRSPKGIAADETGNVYIADTENHRIVHLFNPKSNVEWRRALGTRGTKPGQFRSPQGIAADSDGRLYVADTRNNRIQILDSLGHCVRVLSQGLSEPTQIAVSDRKAGFFMRRENALYVIDQNHRRIQKFDFQGRRLAHTSDQPGADVRYEYLCLDFHNQVYATDYSNGRVLKFDRNLSFLGSFGRAGTGDREFLQPRGISIWRRFGQVFVAEKSGAQYYWIGTDCRDLAVRSAEGRLRLDLFAQEPSYVTLYTTKANDTCFGLKRRWVNTGENRIPASACAGPELFVRLEPTYSSFTYFAKGLRRSQP